MLREVITKVPLNDDTSRQRLEEAAGASTGVYGIAKYGCKVQSQNGEDGIIYHLLQAVGTTTQRTVVEICAGNGIECNSANLILNHNFTGYLFDGNANEIKEGVAFYTKHMETDPSLAVRVRFANTWVTQENIVATMNQLQIPKEVDLLVMDIDGNDYWVLKAIMESGSFSPRVLCVEYQDIIGPERALTIPYRPDFNHREYDCYGGPNYCGASLQAFIKLLGEKYAFVGCEGLGFNGFFVRRDLMSAGKLVEMTDVRPCFAIDKVQFGMSQRWPRTSHMEWIDIGNT